MIYSFDGLTFGVLSVNEYEHEDGVFSVRARSFAALSFRTEGEGEFQINGERFVSRAGDITFIPQNMPYEAEYRRSKSVVFHLTNCNYFGAENFVSENKNAYRFLFEKAMADWKTSFGIFGVKSIVYQILQMLADEKTVFSERAEDGAFAACARYVKENFCNPDLSLSFLSRKFYVGEATICRNFRRFYNASFHEFLSKLRFDKAFFLLSSGREKISAIAAACGFKDEKYFSRAIKKRFGCPPCEIVAQKRVERTLL